MKIIAEAREDRHIAERRAVMGLRYTAEVAAALAVASADAAAAWADAAAYDAEPLARRDDLPGWATAAMRAAIAAPCNALSRATAARNAAYSAYGQ